jgi:hypothetical protein
MKKILFGAFVVTCLAIGALVGQNLRQRHFAFTAVVVENHFDAEGNSKSPFVESHSVWEDGSTEDIRHSVSGRPSGVRRIVDLGQAVRIVLDPVTSSRTTYTITPSEVGVLQSKEACSQDPSAGTLLGIPVVSQTLQRRNGETKAVTTRKLAPSLDCFPLYDSTVVEDAAGKPFATVTRTVTAVMRSEPDRADFSMGKDFVERKPSEVMTINRQQRGLPCPECASRTNTVLDQVYAGRAVTQ